MLWFFLMRTVASPESHAPFSSMPAFIRPQDIRECVSADTHGSRSEGGRQNCHTQSPNTVRAI